MTWKRRIGWSALTLLAIGAGIAIVAYGVFTSYYSLPPKPDYPKPRSLAEAQRDDLDYLRKLPWLDWSYTPHTRAEAERVIDAALKQKFPMTLAAFDLVVARVNAIADNGHTNAWVTTRANTLNRLPVRLYPFADGMFVVRALPQGQALLGAKLLAVDGHPVEEIAKRVSIYTGGTSRSKLERLPFYLESPELLHAAGVANASSRVVYTVRLSDGTTEQRLLRALAPDPKAPQLWPNQELKPQRNIGEKKDWIPALRGKADGLLMFANGPAPFYAAPLPGRNAFYIRFDANADAGGMRIADFAGRAYARVVAAHPAIVIVDMRMNGGGDYTTTAHFMRTLPAALPKARFFILTSGNTFSAGMTSTAFVKQAAGNRAKIVGSMVGDRMRFHAEGTDFCLPFSHVCMGARTAIHDYSERVCTPLYTCFALNLLYPVTIKTFKPDIVAPLTYSALSHGHDPALDAIFASTQR